MCWNPHFPVLLGAHGGKTRRFKGLGCTITAGTSPDEWTPHGFSFKGLPDVPSLPGRLLTYRRPGMEGALG